MGCVVNGPGEARDADIGIAAGYKKGHLFVRAATSPWCPRTRWSPPSSSGPSSSTSTASRPRSPGSTPPRPSGRPRRTGPGCWPTRGADANASEQKVELIHKRIDA